MIPETDTPNTILKILECEQTLNHSLFNPFS